MGKQTIPRAIAELPEGSLQRSDAAELYADTPKRVIFDALWAVVSHKEGKNPYDVTVELTEMLRWQR
jgi:hypothetical protein